MTLPSILFCPQGKAQTLSVALGIPILKPNRGGITKDLQYLRDGNPIIVTDEHLLLMGWVAPTNTIIIFIEGFPAAGPIREQAEGRVHRMKPKIVSSSNDTPIAGTELSNRSKNALRNNGIMTVEHLTTLSHLELLRVPNLGRVCTAEIETFVKMCGKPHARSSQ